MPILDTIRRVLTGKLSEGEWKEVIRKEGLDIRTDEELEEMFAAHAVKLSVVEPEAERLRKYPDVIRHQLEEERDRQIEDMRESELTDTVIEEEVGSQLAYNEWKVAKLREVGELIVKEQEFRAKPTPVEI